MTGIITTLSMCEFMDAFVRQGRDYFSYEGYAALYDYLYSLSEDLGEAIELDVTGLTCEYAEEDPDEIFSYYGLELDEDEIEGFESWEVEDLMAEEAVRYLEYHGGFAQRLDNGKILYRYAF